MLLLFLSLKLSKSVAYCLNCFQTSSLSTSPLILVTRFVYSTSETLHLILYIQSMHYHASSPSLYLSLSLPWQFWKLINQNHLSRFPSSQYYILFTCMQILAQSFPRCSLFYLSRYFIFLYLTQRPFGSNLSGYLFLRSWS